MQSESAAAQRADIDMEAIVNQDNIPPGTAKIVVRAITGGRRAHLDIKHSAQGPDLDSGVIGSARQSGVFARIERSAEQSPSEPFSGRPFAEQEFHVRATASRPRFPSCPHCEQ